MELPESKPDMLVCLLLQRHVNVIDADETLHLTDPKTARTLAFYAAIGRRPAPRRGGVGRRDRALGNDVGRGKPLCRFSRPTGG